MDSYSLIRSTRIAQTFFLFCILFPIFKRRYSSSENAFAFFLFRFRACLSRLFLFHSFRSNLHCSFVLHPALLLYYFTPTHHFDTLFFIFWNEIHVATLFLYCFVFFCKDTHIDEQYTGNYCWQSKYVECFVFFAIVIFLSVSMPVWMQYQLFSSSVFMLFFEPVGTNGSLHKE